jgi:hypothetical protein
VKSGEEVAVSALDNYRYRDAFARLFDDSDIDTIQKSLNIDASINGNANINEGEKNIIHYTPKNNNIDCFPYFTEQFNAAVSDIVSNFKDYDVESNILDRNFDRNDQNRESKVKEYENNITAESDSLNDFFVKFSMASPFCIE